MKRQSFPLLTCLPRRSLPVWGRASHWLLLVIFLSLGFLHSVTVRAGEVIVAARVAGDDQHTRFIADLTGSRSYSVYVLANPYRVVIDIPDVSFKLPSGAGHNTRGLVSEYRYGEMEKGKSRIVLDTLGPVLIEKSYLVNRQAGQPARIVIDLVKTSEEEFLASLQKDEGTNAPSPQPEQLADGESAQEQVIAQEIAQEAVQEAAQAKAQEESESGADVSAAAQEIQPPAEVAAQQAALAAKQTSAAVEVAASEAIVPDVTAEETNAARAGAAAGQPPAKPPAPPATLKPLAPKKTGKRVIVIDPGHGGIDPGASSPDGIKEKTIVLEFANALQAALAKSGRYEVVLTRSDDSFLRLRHRMEVARQNSADLFIAIHADTVRGQDARGATIYTLSDKASDAEAEALASKENRADIIGSMDFEVENKEITNILIDLAQRESKNHAMLFSKKVVTQLMPVTLMTGKPIRSAGFVVLKAPDVPSVLLELGYLSSKEDVKLLTSSAWQTRTAKALASAIDKYFATELAARN